MKFKLRKSNWFDRVVYKLFMYRWNPIFKDNPLLAIRFSKHIAEWTRSNYSLELNDDIDKIIGEFNAR